MTSTKNSIIAKVRPLVRAHLKKSAPPSRVTVGWPVYDESEILAGFGTLLDLRLSQGPAVKKFEEQFAKYVGVKYAVAVNSGSSANLLALTALIASGKAKPGMEVILPASTFATVASPVIQAGFIPVYVDVDSDTWNIDPREVEKAITKKTCAIMAVHMLGCPAPMQKICAIARKHKLLVIEDSCEAHGARIGKQIVGSFGDMATLSFFVAHNITTGEGGMIFTNSKNYYDLLVSLHEFGRLPPEKMKGRLYKDSKLGEYDARYIFTNLGYNVRMTDICASLGIEQLKKLDSLNAQRNKIAATYSKKLKKYDTYLKLPATPPQYYHSFYAYGMLIQKEAPFKRKELTEFLESRGIETRGIFAGCLPDQPGFRNAPGRSVGKLPVSRWIRDNGLFIGCHAALTQKHVSRVIEAFEIFLGEKHKHYRQH